jgi:hypothetical protein
MQQPKTLVLSMFNSFQTMKGTNDVLIHDDHRCRGTALIPQELLNRLKDEGDSTNKARSINHEN